MATIQALTRLTAGLELAERADQQARALAQTFKNVLAEIDAILLDADMPIAATLVEKAVGNETQFSLRAPIAPGSVKLLINGKPSTAFTVDENSGALTLSTPVAKDAQVGAKYTVLGLRSQLEPLAAAVGITPEIVGARKAKYLQAIKWIEANFGI
jgi:hypothetical protein